MGWCAGRVQHKAGLPRCRTRAVAGQIISPLRPIGADRRYPLLLAALLGRALSTMDALEASNWGVAGALAAPHLLYAYIWFLPKQWQAIFKKRSVETFETVAWLLKSECGAAAGRPGPEPI